VILVTNIAEERDKQECGLVDEIPGEIRTKMPWTAGIFIRSSPRHPYQFLVAGSVIGPSTVITLFGGGYGAPHSNRKYTLPQPENILVGTGLKSTILDNNDQNSQFSQVNSESTPRHLMYIVLSFKAPCAPFRSKTEFHKIVPTFYFSFSFFNFSISYLLLC
jgi:hypothetical protein